MILVVINKSDYDSGGGGDGNEVPKVNPLSPKNGIRKKKSRDELPTLFFPGCKNC